MERGQNWQKKKKKKNRSRHAPEEPIYWGIDESDGGDRTRRAARTTSTCQETKKGENNIQGTSINIPASPEVINREKDAPHNPHTHPPAASKQAESDKRTAPPPVPINRDEPRKTSNQPIARSIETRNASKPASSNTETSHAGKQSADRHDGRAMSDKPHRTARQHGRHRPATRPDGRQVERGDGNARHPRDRESEQGASSRDRGRAKPRTFEAKKRRGEVFIPSSPSPDRAI